MSATTTLEKSESREIINVPSYELLSSRAKKYARHCKEKLDIFQVNSTKQEKCARNNNHRDDNIVL